MKNTLTFIHALIIIGIIGLALSPGYCHAERSTNNLHQFVITPESGTQESLKEIYNTAPSSGESPSAGSTFRFLPSGLLSSPAWTYIGFILSLPLVFACTRVMYKGKEDTIITARSMDWKDEIPPNMWIFPRGMERNGMVGPNSIKWTSRYGSLIVSAYDIATVDGMNEKGLVANLLWLAESEYPSFKKDGSKKGLIIAAWAQYVLDCHATVAEAVDRLKQEDFVIVSENIPQTDKFTTVHLSVSDPSGDNAIFEFINGKLKIHHDPSYTVMTNSPPFDKQLAINQYWDDIPGTVMLPGTNRATDRFVRASFYINVLPQTADIRQAIAGAFGVIRNCSVPLGISTKDEPNISSTRWRSVADQKNLVYFFETTLTPNTFWVDMKKIDFARNIPVKKLSLDDNATYAGESHEKFKDAQPFEFAGI